MVEHGGDIYSHPGVLDFSANLNPLGMPKAVREAAAQAAAGAEAYPDPSCRELAGCLSKALSVPEEWILFGNGAEELISAMGRVLSGGTCSGSILSGGPLSAREVLLPVPAFGEYEESFRRQQCRVRHFYLKKEEGYRVPEKILEEITPRTGVLVLCSPNNPTGICVPRSLLWKILGRCEETGTFFLLDESFLPFVKGAESLKSELPHSPHLVMIGSFTKIFSMAGLRLGFCLSSDHGFLHALREQVPYWNVSTVAQAAGCAALQEKEYLAETIPYVEKERELLKKGLEEKSMRVENSQANYLFFHGPEDLGRRLLEQGILVRDCRNYPGLYAGDFRIAVRTDEENRKFLHALEAVWQNRL